MKDRPTRAKLFADASPELRDALVAGLDQREKNEWDFDFANSAHHGQSPPDGDWRVWLVMAGRGFGKTRAGAEWVRAIAERDNAARIALVAANLGEARSVMVEGDSGVLACCPPDRRPIFEPSLRRLRWPGGAEATLFSAAEPESLRGPQHSHGWCDEVAKWSNAHGKALAAWDNLQLGLRLGHDQRVLATTTPRAVPLVRRLIGSEDAVVTDGATWANTGNLPASFFRAMDREYAGTRRRDRQRGKDRDRRNNRHACNTWAFSIRVTGTAWTLRRSGRKEGIQTLELVLTSRKKVHSCNSSRDCLLATLGVES